MTGNESLRQALMQAEQQNIAERVNTGADDITTTVGRITVRTKTFNRSNRTLIRTTYKLDGRPISLHNLMLKTGDAK